VTKNASEGTTEEKIKSKPHKQTNKQKDTKSDVATFLYDNKLECLHLQPCPLFHLGVPAVIWRMLHGTTWIAGVIVFECKKHPFDFQDHRKFIILRFARLLFILEKQYWRPCFDKKMQYTGLWRNNLGLSAHSQLGAHRHLVECLCHNVSVHREMLQCMCTGRLSETLILYLYSLPDENCCDDLSFKVL